MKKLVLSALMLVAFSTTALSSNLQIKKNVSYIATDCDVVARAAVYAYYANGGTSIDTAIKLRVAVTSACKAIIAPSEPGCD